MRYPIAALAAAFVACLAAADTSARVADESTREPITLETLVVTGKMPGPALWRVQQGENTLWLLGTVSPMPSGMDWDTAEIAALLAEAGEVLAPPGADADVGASDVFKMATLVRSARAAMKLPDRKRLHDVLDPELHARWSTARGIYQSSDQATDRLRPVFASQDLYFAAITASGMTRDGVAWNRVRDLATEAAVPITQTRISYPLAIDRGRYRAGIRALANSKVEDIACFTRTLDGLAADLERMRGAASAWATGDMEALRTSAQPGARPPCQAVYDAAMGFQQRPGLDAQVAQAWAEAAAAALSKHRVSLAVLPISDLLAARGPLARLREQGVEVAEPW